MEDIWDEVSVRYEDWYETPLGRAVDEAERRAFLRLLEPRVGERILEVGCGTGHWTKWFREGLGMRVVGLDFSEGMLAVARGRLPDVPLVRGDATFLPFKDRNFDVVAAVTVLEFVQEPKKVLDEMWRCVRPGGRMVVGALHDRSPLARRRRASDVRTVLSHARFFGYDELKELLRHYGPVRMGECVRFPSTGWGVRTSWMFEIFGRLIGSRSGAFLIGVVPKSPTTLQKRD
ncbi:MAG TPA: methyltransferase domain-containing protein [Candidatus Latescibacteria bacterium]|nr:methyltransferase domain-containing protein [Candidatus Latescibacterota bacterium]